MGIKCPTVDEGEIYCIREVDFITGTPGEYVKLGKTSRDTQQRLREHQTGNPRKETAEFVLYTDMMSSLEKFLHYRFAPHCINSEWFKIDTPTVMADVAPLIQDLAKEHATVRPLFDEWKAQSKTVSNGKVLPATPAHVKLREDYLTHWDRYKLVEGHYEIAKLELQMMIGTHNGIENMAYLVTSETQDFDKDGFLAKLSSDADRDACHKTTTKVLPEAPKVHGERSLGKIDAALNKKLGDLKKAYNAQKPDPTVNLANPQAPMTAAMIAAHQAYLNSKNELKEAEWALEKTTAKLVNELNDHDEIEGVIAWKREEKTSKSFDKGSAAKLFPAQFAAHQGAEKTVIRRVQIDDGRKYP